jgi:GDP-D-mannose 3',5'-epimerase
LSKIPNLTVVCGAGGFIGGHLVKQLARQGAVRAVDVKPVSDWFQISPNVENVVIDLRHSKNAETVLADASAVFNFAADMGGMGFIESNKTACMLNVLINTHLLQAAANRGIKDYFFASSACVYPLERQRNPQVIPLKEEDAYPANPEDGYGWEKLFSERMCRHFSEEKGIQTRVARFHNVYGPLGTYKGGREKAPAAICRKVIEAKLSGRMEIEIWGDGTQSRSFLHIDDCLRGIGLMMKKNVLGPLNIGSEELVTINELVDIVEEIAEVRLKRIFNRRAPQGVRGRNSDNEKAQALLGWKPAQPLRTGLRELYDWIFRQMTDK